MPDNNALLPRFCLTVLFVCALVSPVRAQNTWDELHVRLGPLPDGVEVSRRVGPGKQVFVIINYSQESRRVALPHSMNLVLEGKPGNVVALPPYGVAVALGNIRLRFRSADKPRLDAAVSVSVSESLSAVKSIT